MNRIKTYLGSIGRGTRVLVLSLAVIFVGAGIAQAATTLSTNILTNGTLGATGVSTFGGTASTTISVAGVLTTPSSAVALFLGGASTTQFTLLSGDTIKNSTASTTNVSGTLTPDVLAVTGATSLASTTATSFKVGNLGTQMSQIVSGYCVTAASALTGANATSTLTNVNCTPYTSAGVAVTNLTAGTSRVLVMATSSLPSYVLIQAASTTGTATINVNLLNTSTSTTVASAVYAFNFIAFQ